MNKFSINDWLTIQTRKDLTFIRRSLEHESVNYAIFADLFIALFSFVLDHILWTVKDPVSGDIEQVTPSWYWIFIAVLLAVIPIIIFVVGYIRRKINQADFKKTLPVDYLIDLFDNEICYNVMTADAMRDHLLLENSILEEEIRRFYFIETSYYANKATTQLFYFLKQNGNAIKSDGGFNSVSCVRFQNTCQIILIIYKELIEYAEKNEAYRELLEECRDGIEKYNSLVFQIGNRISELHEMTKWKLIMPKRLEQRVES